MDGRGLPGWHDRLPTWNAGESVATRHAIKACFDATLDVVPGLLTGGADDVDLKRDQFRRKRR
jgi:hypothetical protein